MKIAASLFITMIGQGFPVQSGPLATDAFGIFDAETGPRQGWSGFVETLGKGEVSGQLRPAGAGYDIVFHLGEKSLVAGGKPGQVLALVLDADGNLAIDGTEVTFVTGPDTAISLTRQGIASHLFAAGVTAGQFHAGAGIAGRQSGQVDFVVHSDAASVTLRLPEGPGSPALEEDYRDLATLPLTDRFGNTVEDGTGIGLQLTHEDGTVTLLDGVVEGGAGHARFLARDTAPKAMATASLAKARSNVVAFQVTPLEPLGDVTIRAEYLADILATRLVAGPFLTTAGHVLNDGATVEIEVATARGGKVQVRGWVLDGATETTLLVGAEDYPIDVVVTSALGRVVQRFPSPMTGDAP